MRKTVLLAATFFSVPAWAYDVITIDGINDFSSAAELPGTSSSTWWVDQDTQNIYIGVDAADVASNSASRFVVVYIDSIDGQGSSTGVTYNTQQPGLPFDADFHFRWRADNTYTNLLDYNPSSGSWDDDNTALGTFGVSAFQSGTYLEISIPQSSLENPDDIRVTAAMINEQGGGEYTFFMMPASQTEGYNVDHTASVTVDLSSPAAVPFLPVWALGGLAGMLGLAGVRMSED